MATSCLHLLALLRRFLLPAALLLGFAQAHAGLIGHWKFDETSGTTAADSSGSGNTGTLTNMTGSEWTTGKGGGALDFDGTNDYVNLGTSLANNLGDVTFSAWIYREGSTTSFGEIFAKNTIIALSVNNSNDKLRLNFADGSSWSPYPESGSTLPLNQWVHVAGTRSGSTVKVYLDGVLEGTATNSRTGSNSNALGIGHKPGSGFFFNGLLDEVRYYDHALSAGEISALAAGGAGAPEPAETFAFLGLLTAAGLGFREWRSRRKAKAA